MKKRMLLSLFLPAMAFLFLGCQQNMKLNERTIGVEVTVPDSAWRVTILEVYRAKDRLLVISSLHRDPEVMAAQVISRATDAVRIPAPDLPVKHYVLGKTFGWAQDPHRFIQNREEIEEELKSAKLLYQRKKE